MGILILIIMVIVIISLALSDPGTSSTKITPQRKFGDGASMYDFKDYVNAKADKHLKEMEIKRENKFRQNRKEG